MTGDPRNDMLTGQRVLVVEDEWVVAAELETELTDMGCHVVGPVPSVREALDILERQTVDVALVDIGLGEETGYPVADALRAGDVPIVFLTGYSAMALAPEFRDVRCLQKPAAAKRLAAALAAALAKRNSRPARRDT
jgi:CheY-like chemotaxis protein